MSGFVKRGIFPPGTRSLNVTAPAPLPVRRDFDAEKRKVEVEEKKVEERKHPRAMPVQGFKNGTFEAKVKRVVRSPVKLRFWA